MHLHFKLAALMREPQLYNCQELLMCKSAFLTKWWALVEWALGLFHICIFGMQ